MSNGEIKMAKQPKNFTQLIPSTQSTTNFLLDILENLLDSDLLTESQKNQLDQILDSSFNQIQILSKKEYIPNTPFSEFFFENCPSLSQPKTQIN